MPDRAVYAFRPIGARQALMRMFKIGDDELSRLETDSDEHYREKHRRKRDGDIRICYDAKPLLKSVQARIKCMILKKVVYPSYLMGGIADKTTPRDYVSNAHVHVGARVLINEDVEKFFPSISASLVFDIWKHFFHFPADVSRTLTELTTRRGVLPQGAKTSSYLANLAFWTVEPDLVSDLRRLGFEYTRYIDDITISSREDRTKEDVGKALSAIAAMLKRHGLNIKRSKHSIKYAGQRMEVTGLVIGHKSAGLGRMKKSRIRALVYKCEQQESKPVQSHIPPLAIRRATSLVGQLKRLHPRQGQALQERLSTLRDST